MTTKPATCHPQTRHYAKGLCRNCYMRGFRKSHPEWVEYNRQYAKQWREVAENRVKDSEYRKKYRADEMKGEKIRARGRRSNVRQKYGLTDAQYDTLLAEYGYACAICFGNDVLCVDHCHETGKVRGILCARCNSGIGFLRDSAELTKRAAEYLNR